MNLAEGIEPSLTTEEIRLVCLDFDGTILTYDTDPAGVFHPAVIEVLNDLEGRGIRWCANSGRDFEDQLRVLHRSRASGLIHDPVALICSESVVYVWHQAQFQSLEPWNTEAHHRLRQCHRRVQDRLQPKLDYIHQTYEPLSSLIGDHYTAFLLRDHDGMPLDLYRDLERFLVEEEEVMLTRNGGWVAVMHRSLGKGNALLALARHIGLSRDHILAIGDHHNDLPMLRPNVARHVGCPGDAIPEVRHAVKKAGGMIADERGPLGTVDVIRSRLVGAPR